MTNAHLKLVLGQFGHSAGEDSTCVVLRLQQARYVWDADPEPSEPPVPFGRGQEWESGRGLALVRACADVWGWQPLTREGDRGKYVWCEPAALLQTA